MTIVCNCAISKDWRCMIINCHQRCVDHSIFVFCDDVRKIPKFLFHLLFATFLLFRKAFEIRLFRFCLEIWNWNAKRLLLRLINADTCFASLVLIWHATFDSIFFCCVCLSFLFDRFLLKNIQEKKHTQMCNALLAMGNGQSSIEMIPPTFRNRSHTCPSSTRTGQSTICHCLRCSVYFAHFSTLFLYIFSCCRC